ncbi:hypothetical protein HZB78_04095 [Candidatus Collierbacteria bacterium]|nr:hypothetical protein [Candidatus Collierbacteria bacterium]
MQLSRINNTAKQFFFDSGLSPEKDQSLFRIELMMVLFSLLMLPVAWWVYRNVPSEIPIFYSRPWGIPQLAPAFAVYWLAGSGIAITVIHTLLAIKLHKDNRLLSQVSLWSGIYLLILIAISLLTVYYRVGSTGL